MRIAAITRVSIGAARLRLTVPITRRHSSPSDSPGRRWAASEDGGMALRGFTDSKVGETASAPEPQPISVSELLEKLHLVGGD